MNTINSKAFGKMTDGTEISAYTIKNKTGMEATVIDYGAVLTRLVIPKKNGEKVDVVLGYDTLEPYFTNGCYFGATIGRNSNRVKDAKCVIDGKEYALDVNDGVNNLHTSDETGYHKRKFDFSEDNGSAVLSLKDKDMSQKFPGNLDLDLKVSVEEDANEITLEYTVKADKITVCNLTNHSYFNLKGHDSETTILDEKMMINADKYVPVVAGAIPTGELEDVTGTVFDLRTPQVIGEHIDKDVEQLKLVSGYDHNWCLNSHEKEENFDNYGVKAAEVTDEKAGLKMEVYTSMPGIQFYAGNFITEQTGKDGAKYGKRSALCLETQFFPDFINNPEWPSGIIEPGKEYKYKTTYRFVEI